MNKEVENSLEERKRAGVKLSMVVNKGKTGKKHNYEMKAVRLFFEVYIETIESSGVFDKYLTPVTSTAVYDKSEYKLINSFLIAFKGNKVLQNAMITNFNVYKTIW